jgi:membrane protease YdiL (CAAX protease family)
MIIITTNFLSACFFGTLIGKWVFIPIILIEWCWFIFFIAKFGGRPSIKLWLRQPDHNSIWTVFAVILGLVPFPIFILYKVHLAEWTVLLPWIIQAIVNPWPEEFYWRGLLLDNTSRWNKWIAILFSSLLFAANHAVFAIHSELMRSSEIFVSTLVMGIVWAVAYKKNG